MELRRLLRTRAVFSYVLLPAVLLLPVILAGATLVASMYRSTHVLALPQTLPARAAVTEALEEASIEPFWTSDPAAAWASGEVDAAVLGSREGTGIYQARPALEAAQRYRWQLDLVAEDAEVAEEIEDALEEAGEDVLRSWVALAGADPGEVVTIARIRSFSAEDDWVVPPAGILAYAVFLLGVVAYFSHGLSGVSERLGGVTESLLTTPAPVSAVLMARLVATSLLQLAVALALGANLLALFGRAFSSTALPDPGWLAAGVGGTVLLSAGYLVAGTLAPSIKDAINSSSLIMLGDLGLKGLGAGLSLPAWVPVAGMGAVRNPTEGWIAGALSLLLAGLVVGALAQVVGRSARFKVGAAA